MVTPTTKYTKKHSRNRGLDSRNDKVVIAESDDEVKEYICPSCSRIRHTRQLKGELECLHCGETLDEIERQLAESRKKGEEYEKTVRLLRLVNRDKE